MKALKDVKQLAVEDRLRGTRVAHRTKRFVVFIDFEKAFDRVDRALLIDKLRQRQISDQLTDSICLHFKANQAQINGEDVRVNIGTAQGAVLSPTLFNTYIDSLIRTLATNNLQVLAFADDIVFVAIG